MIDRTGSMSSLIAGVKNKCKKISNKLNENNKLQNMVFFYRDKIDSNFDKDEYQLNVYNLKNKIVYAEEDKY